MAREKPNPYSPNLTFWQRLIVFTNGWRPNHDASRQNKEARQMANAAFPTTRINRPVTIVKRRL